MNNTISDKCEGCNHIQEGKCKMWVCPTAKWKLGDCPNSTHVDKGIKRVTDEKIRVGQQKQAKVYKK